MTEKTKTTGRMIWRELMTQDVKGASVFYGELFGWKSKSVDMGSGPYTILELGSQQIGGIAHLDPKHNLPNYWMAYCTVPNVDATVKKAETNGATVLVPASDIPNLGRFAIVRDPQGAVLGPYTPVEESPETADYPAVGTFCWDELQTSDPKAAADFYQSLYAWKAETRDMGPMGTYYRMMRGASNAAGIMKSPMPSPRASWLHYVASDDVDATARRAESLRARVVVPPSNIPGVGRFAVFADPSGAVIAAFKGDPSYVAERARAH